MAIIYTYPIKTSPASKDTLLISDSQDNNKTKQVTIADIRSATVSGVSSIIAGTPNVTLNPVAGVGDVTISVSTPTPPVVVDDFSNANGTFVSFGTENTNATGSVDVGTVDLSATGTPDATKFLRGDNTWAVPAGGGTMTSFDVDADAGGATSISDGDTVNIFGGAGISTSNAAGTITVTNTSPNIPTNLTLAGDGGTPQTISDGDTITIEGGTGLSSSAGATDKVTIKLDDTTVTADTYTNATITVDAQGRLTAASNGADPSVNATWTPNSIYQGDNTPQDQPNPITYFVQAVADVTMTINKVKLLLPSDAAGTNSQKDDPFSVAVYSGSFTDILNSGGSASLEAQANYTNGVSPVYGIKELDFDSDFNVTAGANYIIAVSVRAAGALLWGTGAEHNSCGSNVFGNEYINSGNNTFYHNSVIGASTWPATIDDSGSVLDFVAGFNYSMHFYYEAP